MTRVRYAVLKVLSLIVSMAFVLLILSLLRALTLFCNLIRFIPSSNRITAIKAGMKNVFGVLSCWNGHIAISMQLCE